MQIEYCDCHTDRPRLRAIGSCPICHKDKDCGQVVCWPCYRKQGLKWGNPKVEEILDQWEKNLEAEGT